MCGICGTLDLLNGPANPGAVSRMADAIAHRGPDGQGIWSSGSVALGHRRLSIIDTTDGGRQPMQTQDGRYTIVYNGELYNYREIRTELQAFGYRFSSQSDTEVILKAFAAWGVASLARFNGIFALGLWDNENKTLLLCRDRTGVKPLYWSVRNGVLVFSSEVKGIVAFSNESPSLNMLAVRRYITFQNFFDSSTLWEGVQLLPAGSYIEIKYGVTQAHEISPKKWWDFDFNVRADVGSPEDAADHLRFLFKQAVARQMVADVPVGSYLSGGLDSGAVTAVASTLVPNLRTFTCGFDVSSTSGLELYFDERQAAELMSATFKTEHYEMVLKAGDMERSLKDLVRHLEEPRVGQSYPNFLIARLASKFNKVVLSGTGGDELFGGYPWRFRSALASSRSGVRDNIVRAWTRLFPNTAPERLFAPMWSAVKHWSPADDVDAILPSLPAAPTTADVISAVQTFEARTFLQGLLVVEDKVSMAHGLEVRVPFLDNDVVDFAQGLDPRLKVGDLAGIERPQQSSSPETSGKVVLRRALAPLLPEVIVQRGKQGFSAPDASWFKGESIMYVKRRLSNRSSAIYSFVDYDVVQAELAEHFSGKVNRRLAIWSLLYLDEFFGQHNFS